jgi:pyruvate dehydrogenase E2 component (dihydrolipoamide acetyltransferase)
MVQRVELTRGERAVARRVAEIRATVPQVEMSVLASAAAALARAQGERLSLLSLCVAACAAALRAHPRANGSHRGDELELYSRVNVGVVVAGPGVYFIPTVFDADEKSAVEIEGEIARLRTRALEGRLAAPELAGATFTVSDAGAEGLLSLSPLVIPPQAAALSLGAVQELPRAVDGAWQLEPKVQLTLACDHRILYGPVASEFLQTVREHLEHNTP